MKKLWLALGDYNSLCALAGILFGLAMLLSVFLDNSLYGTLAIPGVILGITGYELSGKYKRVCLKCDREDFDRKEIHCSICGEQMLVVKTKIKCYRIENMRNREQTEERIAAAREPLGELTATIKPVKKTKGIAKVQTEKKKPWRI